MKQTRFSALLLTAALVATLSACGGKADPTPTPAAPTPSGTAGTPSPDILISAAPSESPEATEPDTTAAVAPVETPVPSEEPAQSHPIETPKPTSTPLPTSAPTPEPTPEATPAPVSVTAAGIYDAVAEATGFAGFDASFVLEEYYSVDASDLEDYILSMPDMSAEIQEVFVAKAASGKAADVKAACESRQKGMAEDAEFYPDTGTYVADYQLVTSGDWVFFYVGPNAAAAADAFRALVE